MPSTARWGIISSGPGRQQSIDDRQHGADRHDRHVVVGARYDHHRQRNARLGFREIGAFGWPSTDDDPATLLRAGKPRCREISSYPRPKHPVCCSCRDHGRDQHGCVNPIVAVGKPTVGAYGSRPSNSLRTRWCEVTPSEQYAR
jgi:hypothetical protein